MATEFNWTDELVKEILVRAYPHTFNADMGELLLDTFFNSFKASHTPTEQPKERIAVDCIGWLKDNNAGHWYSFLVKNQIDPKYYPTILSAIESILNDEWDDRKREEIKNKYAAVDRNDDKAGEETTMEYFYKRQCVHWEEEYNKLKQQLDEEIEKGFYAARETVVVDDPNGVIGYFPSGINKFPNLESYKQSLNQSK